ncbi:MAG: hypothetical protein ABR532_01980, partial [Candidatus Dormibacteria bacterium]
MLEPPPTPGGSVSDSGGPATGVAAEGALVAAGLRAACGAEEVDPVPRAVPAEGGEGAPRSAGTA